MKYQVIQNIQQYNKSNLKFLKIKVKNFEIAGKIFQFKTLEFKNSTIDTQFFTNYSRFRIFPFSGFQIF